MARLDELTDLQATEFARAFLRWITDEDPAQVGRLFPTLDPHDVDDAAAAELGHAVLEDLMAERFLKQPS